jgi:hypothetical protein
MARLVRANYSRTLPRQVARTTSRAMTMLGESRNQRRLVLHPLGFAARPGRASFGYGLLFLAGAPYPERDAVGWLSSSIPVRGDWTFNPTALK